MSTTSDGPGNTPPANQNRNGGDRDNRDDRDRDRRNRNRAHQRQVVTTKFEGKRPELKGYIYEVRGSGSNADDFTKTTREIAEWIARNYEDGGADICNSIDPDKLAFDPFPAIVPPAATATAVELKLWEFDIKQRYHEELKRKQLSNLAYATVLGQCSRAVRDRLEASNRWAAISTSNDVIALLKLIRSSLFSGATTRHTLHALQDAQDKFYAFRQTEKMTNADYLAQFKNLYDAMTALGSDNGITFNPPIEFLMHAVDPDNPTPDELAIARTRASDEYLGVQLVRRSDPTRYGAMMAGLKNDFTLGVDKYPKTLTDAYDAILHFEAPVNKPSHSNRGQAAESGVSYHMEEGNTGGTGRGGNGGGRGNQGGRGGSAGRGRGAGNSRTGLQNDATEQSTDSARSETASRASSTNSSNDSSSAPAPYLAVSPTSLQTRSHVLNQASDEIPDTWLLADSCSSVDIISSKTLLRNIHKADQVMHLHCNAGTVTLTHQGYLGEYPFPVWYHPRGVANILSLRNLTRYYRVTMDSQSSNCLILHATNGTRYEFHPSASGLYRLVLNTPDDAINMWSFVTTVAEQAQHYTRRDLERAQDARQMQNILMHPSDRQLASSAIRYLANCPVTERDITVATDIFGKNLGSLKGKTVHRPNAHVQTGIAPVPHEILSRHQNVTLAIDIMFVNKIPFLITVSRNIKFVTIEDLPNRKVTTIRDKLRAVLRLYRHRGFHVTSILGDQEFEALREFFPYLNTCGADEHVPDVERMIRTVKDRARSAHSLLPFRSLPRLIVVRLLCNAVLWLNALPNANGVSQVLSPRFLLTGRDLSYDKHVRLPFGAYVQTHEEHTNDLRHRTLGAICLGPTGNSQGGHYFMSLTSGARIIRHRWTPLPMPADAIQRVTEMGRSQHMPSTVTFSDRHGREIEDPIIADLDHYSYHSDDDSTYSDNASSSDDSDESDTYSESSSDDSSAPDPDNHIFNPGPDHEPDLFPHSDSDDASVSSDSSSSTSSSLSAAHTPPALAPLAAVTPGAGHSSATDTDSSSSHKNTGVNTPPRDGDDDYSIATNPPANQDPPALPAIPGAQPIAQETPGVQPLPLENTGVQRDTAYDLFRQAEAHGQRAALGQATPGRPQRETRSTRRNEYR